jgi:DNA modification methylase
VPPRALATITDLTPDAQNANAGTKRGRDLLETSLDKYGAGRSVLVDKHGRVIAGNKTHEAAVDAQMPIRVIQSDGHELIVHQRTDLDLETDPRARELAYMDNRASEVGLSWDEAQLKADLDKCVDLSASFFDEELRTLIGEGPKAGLTDADDVPLPRATAIKVGDLFELGRHRLLCGDCTQPGTVRQLMGDHRAGLMNIDPPYGIAYANDDRPNPGVVKPRVANDLLQDRALQDFLESAFRSAVDLALTDNAAWYLWHAHLTQGFFAAAAAAANVVLHRQIIWVKPVLLLGRGQYHWKHEPCFMGWVEGHQPPDYGLGAGERTQTTVWEVDSISTSERRTLNVSTPKPVGLFKIPITKHLKLNEIAFDGFAGSGPQMIAAEQLGRRCFAIDIDPVCCQVILDRWEAFTGATAVKVAEALPA